MKNEDTDGPEGTGPGITEPEPLADSDPRTSPDQPKPEPMQGESIPGPTFDNPNEDEVYTPVEDDE